nr:MAG TPA: hypothetical protein [Crassvirales sp.]
MENIYSYPGRSEFLYSNITTGIIESEMPV